VGHRHVGLEYAHVWHIPQGCRGSAPRMSLYAPSAKLSFASLDICICPVEYDESLAYLQKVNIHLFISLVIIHKVTLWVTCHLYTWSRWNPPIKNKMDTRTLFSSRGSHPRLQAIKLLASLTQSTQNFVPSHARVVRPSPHQCPTCHRSPRGQ
jgi:hypothetical protein